MRWEIEWWNDQVKNVSNILFTHYSFFPSRVSNPWNYRHSIIFPNQIKKVFLRKVHFNLSALFNRSVKWARPALSMHHLKPSSHNVKTFNDNPSPSLGISAIDGRGILWNVVVVVTLYYIYCDLTSSVRIIHQSSRVFPPRASLVSLSQLSCVRMLLLLLLLLLRLVRLVRLPLRKMNLELLISGEGDGSDSSQAAQVNHHQEEEQHEPGAQPQQHLHRVQLAWYHGAVCQSLNKNKSLEFIIHQFSGVQNKLNKPEWLLIVSKTWYKEEVIKEVLNNE